MEQILTKVLGLSAMIAIPLSSFLMGLKFGGLHLKVISENRALLTKFSIVMYIIVPAIAVLLYYYNVVDKTVWSGLFLVSISPLMPLIVGKGKNQDEKDHLRLAWFITAMVLSLFLIPLNVFLVKAILNVDFELGYGTILGKLMILFIVPLALGFLASRLSSKVKESMLKYLGILVNIAMLILVLSILIIAVPTIYKGGIVPVILVLAFVLLTLAIGLVFGKSDKVGKLALPASLLLRLPAPAIIIAQTNDTLKMHLPVILLYMFLGIFVLLIYAKLSGTKINM